MENDPDIPEEEIVCYIEKNEADNSIDIVCVPDSFIKNEIKPQAVISSNVNGMVFGTWTPSLVGSGIIDVSARSAHYVKVGQLITCTFEIIVDNMSGGKKDSEITLSGLPELSFPSGYNSGSVHISYYKNMNTEVSYISGTVASNDTRAALWFQHHSLKTLNRLTQLDINVGTVLIGTVNYISNS